MTPEQQQEIQKRQRSRSIVMALVLGAFVILFFAVAWAKIAQGTMH
ncbi:MAG TPA: hypothetical protein VGE65_02190 [Sphingobium sp.]